MKTSLTIIALLIFSSLKAQVALNYYPFQSILSVSSNTENLLFADCRIETNTFISNVNIEFAPMVQLMRSPMVNYYTGAGVSINFVNLWQDLPLTNGYILIFGSRIKPLEKNKNVQLVFEISPYVNKEFSGGNLRTRLGVAYNFLRKKD